MGPEVLVNLIVAAVFGAICAAIANSRGRSAIGWFFIGAITSCIGIILVLVLPDLKVQAEREERMRRENRRLREKLRKERMVADKRHEAAMGRLDVHDDALGLDTGQDPTRIASESSAAPTEQPRPAARLPDDGTEWYYLQGQERIGPITAADLQDLWVDGRIDASSLVWCAAMADWAAISTVSKLRRVLGD
jgi:hypothetical protein